MSDTRRRRPRPPPRPPRASAPPRCPPASRGPRFRPFGVRCGNGKRAAGWARDPKANGTVGSREEVLTRPSAPTSHLTPITSRYTDDTHQRAAFHLSRRRWPNIRLSRHTERSYRSNMHLSFAGRDSHGPQNVRRRRHRQRNSRAFSIAQRPPRQWGRGRAARAGLHAIRRARACRCPMRSAHGTRWTAKCFKLRHARTPARQASGQGRGAVGLLAKNASVLSRRRPSSRGTHERGGGMWKGREWL